MPFSLFRWLRGPAGDRRLHLVLTILWAIETPIAILFWSSAIPYLVLISQYAIVVGHWSAYQASRGEESITDGVTGPSGSGDGRVPTEGV